MTNGFLLKEVTARVLSSGREIELPSRPVSSTETDAPHSLLSIGNSAQNAPKFNEFQVGSAHFLLKPTSYLKKSNLQEIMQKKNVNEPSLVEPEINQEPIGPRHLTQSQGEALSQLAAMAHLVGHTQTYGGFRPRLIPLLFGPSGAGKTALLSRLYDTLKPRGDQDKFGLLVVNLGSFVVLGAKDSAPGTLGVIRRFVRRYDSGILLIEELDKCVASSEGVWKSSWDLSVTTEIISLIDAFQSGDSKLIGAGWTVSDIKRLQRMVLVGAGTWQRQARKAVQDCSSHGQAIANDLLIPEEIRLRFGRMIEIKLPAREDFRAAIKRIYSDLAINQEKDDSLEKMVDSAIAAGMGMRWCELLTADLLCRDPHLMKPQPVSEPEVESGKNLVSAADLNAEMKNAFRLMEDAESSLTLFRAQVRLISEKLWKPVSSTDLDLDDRMTAAKMDGHFENVLIGLHFRYAVSHEDRLQREKLMWQSGCLLLTFLSNILEEKAEVLAAQHLLVRAADAYTRLSRVLAAWHYLTTLALHDDAA